MWEWIGLALMNEMTRRAKSSETPSWSRYRVYYRTRDGLADYRFSIERQADGNYRSYIVEQPAHSSVKDAIETHRLTDRRGRQYICWTKTLRTVNDARHVSAAWADAMQEYVKRGKRF